MTTSESMANRRVLVIDDNPAIHDDFRRILQPSERDVALRLRRSIARRHASMAVPAWGWPSPPTWSILWVGGFGSRAR